MDVETVLGCLKPKWKTVVFYTNESVASVTLLYKQLESVKTKYMKAQKVTEGKTSYRLQIVERAVALEEKLRCHIGFYIFHISLSQIHSYP